MNPTNILRAAAVVEPDLGTLVNVTGVEIVQTGIEYPLASGPHTFTVDELADAIKAAEEDPAIKSPRLRLGHSGLQDPGWDGEPAIGTVANMRLEQEGHTIVGDYVGVPEWLANVLPSAYPARSIDGELGVTTNTGHDWRLVITGLALLGVRWPGVSTLDDIKALFSKEGPDGVVVYATKEEMEEGEMGLAAQKVTGRIDTDDIRRQFYNSLSAEQWAWWIRGQYQDPDELIAEDEASGELYRIPYTIEGDDVSFGDPVPVKIDFIDKPQKKEKATAVAAILSFAQTTHKNTTVYATVAESKEGVDVAGTATETPPLDLATLRSMFNVPDTKSDDDLKKELEAAGFVFPPGQEEGGAGRAPGSEQSGTSESGMATTGNDPANVTGPGTDPGNPETAASSPPPVTQSGVVSIDAATLSQLTEDAKLGRAAHTRQVTGDRDVMIAAAIQQGRIPKSREGHWRQQYDKDPEGTTTLLTAAADKGGLAPGLIPVTELGGAPSEDAGDTAEAYPAEWLPEVAARNARNAAMAAAAQGGGNVVPFQHPNAGLMVQQRGW